MRKVAIDDIKNLRSTIDALLRKFESYGLSAEAATALIQEHLPIVEIYSDDSGKLKMRVSEQLAAYVREKAKKGN